MAMLIAWQTVNAVRHPGSRRFTRGFLVVTPGLTIRDRLRVLQPNDPDSYYRSRELVPEDLLPDLERARIVITNYHAFKRRERIEVSRGARSLLTGRSGGAGPYTVETEGQMLQRVMPGLMGMKNVLAINDEAHHCYRQKAGDDDEEGALRGEEKREAELCRVAEAHPHVLAWVKNHSLGFAVPYRCDSRMRTYVPDFIVRVDDGAGGGRSVASRRGDQGLPGRGRERQEAHHGDVLGARREPPRRLRPLSVRRADGPGRADRAVPG